MATSFLKSMQQANTDTVAATSLMAEVDTIDIVEINKYEYEQLKVLNGKTPEEIIDAYTMLLIKEGRI